MATDKDKALAALASLPPQFADERDTWIKVGMALHSVDATLLDDWDTWSQQSGKYEAGVCEQEWLTFNGEGGVGLGTLMHWAGHGKATPTDSPAPQDLAALDTVLVAQQVAVNIPRLNTFAADLGVRSVALRDLGIGYDAVHGEWTFPERNARGELIGIQRRLTDGQKRMVGGSKRGLSALLPLPATAGGDDTPILIVEGPTDTAAGMSLDFTTIGRPSAMGGTDMVRPLVQGRHVVIVAENDRKPSGDWPGRQGAEQLALALDGIAQSIRILYPPETCKDLRQWGRNVPHRSILLAAIKATAVFNPSSTLILGKAWNRAKRPVLMPGTQYDLRGNEHLRGTWEFAEELIELLDPTTFYRQGTVSGYMQGKAGEREFVQLTSHDTRLRIDKQFNLVDTAMTEKGRNVTFKPCTQDVGGLIRAAANAHDNIRPLTLLIPYPIFTSEWQLAEPGWHDGILYDPPKSLERLPVERDRDRIRATLDDLVVDFPFATESDRCNFFGLLLTPLVRWAVGGNVPLHLVMAPIERVGKSMLVSDVLGGIILGRKLKEDQLPVQEEEIEKRITSMLLKGDTLVNFDNIRAMIDSASLASLLTSTTFGGRLLGQSRSLTLPNNLIVVGSGTNPTATGEIIKRSVPVYLQPTMPDPDQRTGFVHPEITDYVASVRVRVLGALVGAVLNWRDAGRPSHPRPLGGFESWAKCVGGVLAHLGYDQWRVNEADWRSRGNLEGGDLDNLVAVWWETFGERLVAPAELIPLAKREALFADVLTGKTPHGELSAFARVVLRKNENRPVGEHILRRSNGKKSTVFFLEKLGG